MIKLAFKGLLARKLRTVLTGFAVVIGVAFVAGTFVFTDTIDASFKDLFERTSKGTDVSVKSKLEVEADFAAPPTMPADTLDDRALTLLRRRAVGFVFQAYNLLPVLTAEQNVTLPLRIGGRKADPGWLDQLIDAVGLTERRHHRPTEMSGGQQQRVAVARALVTRPAVVFGDEPTGNLDSVSSREVLELMRRAVDDLGQTIVMVTHDPSAAAVADRVVFLADGRLAGTLERPGIDEILDHLRELAR